MNSKASKIDPSNPFYTKSQMKPQTIQGVPYLVDNKDVFVYSSVPPIRIGSYDNSLLTLENWEEKAGDWLAYYRRGLAQQTQDALKRAAELQS